MTLPEPFDNTNNCFATENEKIASSLTDEEIANLNKINRDNTTFINSTIAITNGLNTTIPNLFETIIIAYEHLADLFDQIATINSEISNIKEQIAALTPPE
jgi:hypothetical protein